MSLWKKAPPPPPPSHRLRNVLLGTAAGIALEYVFDPRMGRTRRAKAKDRMASMARRSARRSGRAARFTASQALGKTKSLVHRSPENREPDAATLTQRVRSEVFGRRGFPQGKVVVDAANGIVTLRGQIDDATQMEHIVRMVASVAGVEHVENLLHAPGSPAPNKAPVLERDGRF